MVSLKAVADTLTAIRLCLAGVIVWLGVTSGSEALPTVVVTLILAWGTDVLDGPLARRHPSGRHTWISKHDLTTDMTLNLAVLIYLTLAGSIPLRIAICYGVVCTGLLWYFRSQHLAWAVQAPPYVCMLYVALRDARAYGFVAVVYLLLVIIATWPRFPRELVPQFLEGMRHLGKARLADERSLIQDDSATEHGNDQHWRAL